VQRDQLGEEQPAEELVQHPDWREEGGARGNPARAIARNADYEAILIVSEPAGADYTDLEQIELSGAMHLAASRA
jgi:hypothetical protein